MVFKKLMYLSRAMMQQQVIQKDMKVRVKVSTGKHYYEVEYKGQVYNLWVDKGLGQFDVLENVTWDTDEWEAFLDFANQRYGIPC